MAFSKINYIIMITAIAVMVLGYIIMGMDKEEYGFGSLGLTVGPMTVLAGLGIGLVAIIYKPKKS